MATKILNPEDALLLPELLVFSGVYLWVDEQTADAADDNWDVAVEAYNDHDAFEEDGDLYHMVKEAEDQTQSFMDDEGSEIEDDDERQEALDRWHEGGPGIYMILDHGVAIVMDDYTAPPKRTSKKDRVAIRGESLLQIEDLDDAFKLGRDDTEWLSEAASASEKAESHLIDLIEEFEPDQEIGDLLIYAYDDVHEYNREDNAIFIRKSAGVIMTGYLKKADFNQVLQLLEAIDS